MKPDEVIIVSLDVDTIEDALQAMSARLDELAEKHNLEPPASVRILDGHGTQLGLIHVSLRNSKISFPALVWQIQMAAGLFFVLEDSHGQTAMIKFEIEGQQKTN
jgi:hypothetical protein